MLRPCRILVCCLLGLLTSFSVATAQSSKTVATATGYEEYWTGVGANGADSLYHRVFVTRRNPPRDTIVVRLHSGPTMRFPVHNDATFVSLELSWFKRYLVIDEYPEVHDRRFDRGWSSWYSGTPHRYARVLYHDVISVTIKFANGLELPVTPKLPE